MALEDIIGAAMDKLGDSGDDSGGGSNEVSDTGDSGDVDTGAEGEDQSGEGADGAGTGDAGTADAGTSGDPDPAVDRPADSPAPDPAAAAPAEGDLTDEELNALGLKAPVAGQRENKLPYSRVRKIVGNAYKKAQVKFQGEVAARDTQIKTLSEKSSQMDTVDQLIVNDPDRYIGILAQMHPDKYGKFLKGGAAEPAKAEVPAGSPRPAPDAEYADGSKGYSPEGLEKLLQWTIAEAKGQAIAATEASYAQRFGPIEQSYKQRVARERAERELAPVVQEQLANAKEVWGDVFEADYKLDGKSEVVAYMAAHPRATFEGACSAVFLPKVRKSQSQVRQDTIKDLKGRPAAATGTPTAASTAKPKGARTTEQIISDTLDRLEAGGR